MSDSTQYAEAVVETIRQPLLVLVDTLDVVTANPAFYRHFRMTPGETIGCTLWELGSRDWDNPLLRTLMDRVLSQREPVTDFEIRHDFERLGSRTFLVNARQVEASHQDRQLILVAFEDVTEQRRARSQLQSYAARLERSNRDLEEFAHAASHDLQEPLRKVRTFADRLVQSLDPAVLDERQRVYLERMHDAAGRMQTRIDDLLMLARVSRSQPAHARIDLTTVIEAVRLDLETALDDAGAVLIAGPMPSVEGDVSQLELLFQNLIGNAIKYRRVDLPSVIRIEAGPASDPLSSDRPAIRVTVTDNGIGFDNQYAERIFRPFERLHGRGEYDGSGVGLAICRRVVERHGGYITASGMPGAGATFEMVLPTLQVVEET